MTQQPLSKPTSKPLVLTIGHSNRPLSEFIDALKAEKVNCVVDVRKMTASRSNPQFNEATLGPVLAQEGIDYEHLAALGGLRGKTPDIPGGLNGYWQNASFHRYADYALSKPFRDGLEHLLNLCAHERCVLMCAEILWWRCHRRIISDYLIAHGCSVQHIMSNGHTEAASLTPGAVVRDDLSVIYPATSDSADEEAQP